MQYASIWYASGCRIRPYSIALYFASRIAMHESPIHQLMSGFSRSLNPLSREFSCTWA